jgi:excisionase family DNA binding protein
MIGSTLPIEPAFFDLAGASTYLGGAWSVRTLRRLVSTGELPYYRRGRGKILIKKSDLDGFLAHNRQEAVDLDALADEALAELGMGRGRS